MIADKDRTRSESFFDELKRRNVFRVGAAYVVAAWLVIQVAETIFPLFGFDEKPARIVVIVLAICFIPALLFAWVFEITPEGLKREKDVDRSKSITIATGRTLDRAIMVVLALGIAYFALDKFVLSEYREALIAEEARQEGRAEALVESYGDKSIAVLAFDDMSPQKDQEYLSDGIAEELLNLLTKIPDLRVISRSSAFSYKDTGMKLDQIADELNVAYILQGSVRKSRDRVRIATQLIEAGSDTQIWSTTFDRDLDDIFLIQDHIASAVVQELKVTILSGLEQSSATDSKAYNYFLQARYFAAQGSREGLNQATSLFLAATDVDPRFSRAWSALAQAYCIQAGRGFEPASLGYERARQAALTALSIDSRDAIAHAMLGVVSHEYDNDLQAGAQHLQWALSQEPKNLDVISASAKFLGAIGRVSEAVQLNELLVSADPVNSSRHHNLGYVYLGLDQWDNSIASLRTAISLSPRIAGTHFVLGFALLSKGDAALGLSEMQMEPLEPLRSIGLAMAYHALDDADKSNLAIEGATEKYPEWAYNFAHLHAFRNENDLAFVWLEKAAEIDDPGLAEVVSAPMLKNIHQDPRWPKFLDSVGKSPDDLRAIKFTIDSPL